jgi:hypothetical protein
VERWPLQGQPVGEMITCRSALSPSPIPRHRA